MRMFMTRAAGLGLAVLVCVAAGYAQPAGASGAQVIRDRFHGPFLEGEWHTRTATTATDAYILSAQSQDKVTHLFADIRTTSLDAAGNPTGSVDVSGEATGASLSVDELRLSGGSASGSIPGTRCTFDAAGNGTGCADAGLVPVAASWQGSGDLVQGILYENQFHVPGLDVFIDRESGKFRSATATATIGNVSFAAASGGQFVDMGVANQMTLEVCPKGC